MAAARCLRWGLSRAEACLLPPPTRCCHRALHRQVAGTEFRSAYSLDKLYPESRGADTAWRVPVSQEGRPEGAFPGLRRATPGSQGPTRETSGWSGGRRAQTRRLPRAEAGCPSNRRVGAVERMASPGVA